MIKYHSVNSKTIAELLTDTLSITNSDEILDLMAEVGSHNCENLIIHARSLHPDFFDLKSGLAGEILQKFSNYRMRLSIIGDFSGIKSKSLKDFIRESNRRGIISFVPSLKEALAHF